MADTKKVEFKSVCVFSVFRYFAGVFLVAGLVIGLFGNNFGINVTIPSIANKFTFISNLNPGIPAGIAFAVIYGLAAGIGFSILALLYNLFAGILGGIKCFIKEE